MLTIADMSIWFLSTVVAAFVGYLFVARGSFKKYLVLNLYLLAMVIASIGRSVALWRFGPSSYEYLST